MSESAVVNYAAADAWRQRAESAARAERLARQAVKASMRVVTAMGIAVAQRAEEARLATELAAQAATEAERTCAATASTLRG